MDEVLPISLKLNFTPNTLGCCGLTNSTISRTCQCLLLRSAPQHLGPGHAAGCEGGTGCAAGCAAGRRFGRRTLSRRWTRQLRHLRQLHHLRHLRHPRRRSPSATADSGCLAESQTPKSLSPRTRCCHCHEEDWPRLPRSAAVAGSLKKTETIVIAVSRR